MEIDKIIEIIEKYEEGSASIEEENILLEYFTNNDVPEDLVYYKVWFQSLEQSRKVSVTDEVLNKIWGRMSEKAKRDDQATPIVRLQSQWYIKVAAAIALILLGIYIGNINKAEEIAQVRIEMEEFKSKLQSNAQSNIASSRLQAVNYAIAMDRLDEDILLTLINIIKNDDNQNVRLKAIEALGVHATNATIQKELVNLLRVETEPIVQMELIDAIITNQDNSAIPVFEGIIENENTMTAVKDHAHFGINRLTKI